MVSAAPALTCLAYLCPKSQVGCGAAPPAQYGTVGLSCFWCGDSGLLCDIKNASTCNAKSERMIFL